MLAMNFSVLLALIAFSAVVFAHPHSLNQGECMEMRTPSRGSRSLWFTHEFDCMEDIEPCKEEVIARKVCRGKARRYVMDFFKDDKLDSPKNTSVEDVTTQRDLFYVKCLVERLDLVFQNGSLNTDQVLKNAAKMDSSDSGALLNMYTWMRICIAQINGTQSMNTTNANATTNATVSANANSTYSENSTNSTNAAMQYIGMRNCVQQMMREHCDQEKLLVKEYLQSGNNESVCANISSLAGTNEVTKVFQSCMVEVSMEDVTERKLSSDGATSLTKGKSALTQMMLASTICSLQKMKWFTPEKGLDLVTYTNYVANFTGWNEIPKVLEKLTSAMNSCLSNYTGDVYSQVYNWRFCFTPAVMDICGLNSSLTEFLVPFVANHIRKAAKEYVHDMMDMDDESDLLRDGDDDYDDEDYDEQDDEDFDDDKVDDGLFKGMRQSRTKANMAKNDDDDIETMTESAEVEETGVEMAQLQWKQEISSSVNTKGRASKGPADGATTQKTINDKKSKDSANDSTSEESAETTHDSDDMPDTTTKDDFLIF